MLPQGELPRFCRCTTPPCNRLRNGALMAHTVLLHLAWDSLNASVVRIVGIVGTMNRFDVQPLGRFAGTSSTIRRPKVSSDQVCAALTGVAKLP